MSHYCDDLSVKSDVKLNHIGGKALNLKKLISEKFPVPPGYCIKTEAFDDFLKESGIKEKVQSIIHQIRWENLEEIQKASTTIHHIVMEQELSASLKTVIRTSTDQLINHMTVMKLAVRSSATAEDRLDLSFAGQYDSYLNITSFDDLISSVKQCWASLWSIRALSYYHNNNLDSFNVSMAVVVQEMIETKSAGVIFTVNPVNQNYNELVINAAWGLGEGIVTGKVSPDEYIIDKYTAQIKKNKISRKRLKFSVVNTDIMEVTIPVDQQYQACLTSENIQQLFKLGKNVEKTMLSPQDIEWGIGMDKIYILQSRPITTLLPIKWGNEATRQLFKGQLVYWSNFNTRETMPYPLTPLSASYFMDLLFPQCNKKITGLTKKSMFYAYSLSLDLIYGRLYWNMNFILDSPFREGLEDIDHEAGIYFKKLHKKGILHVPKPKKIMQRILYILFLLKSLVNVLFNIPWFASQKDITRRCLHIWNQALSYEQSDLKNKSIRDLVQDLKHKNFEFSKIGFPLLIATVVYGMMGIGIIKKLIKKWDDIPYLILFSGILGNKTTEGALEMYQLSVMSSSFKQKFLETPVNEISSLFNSCEEGRQFEKNLKSFLEDYGHRGPKEFDIGQPRWRDDPRFIFQMVKNYLQLDEEDLTPLQHFEKVKIEREKKTDLIKERLSKSLISRVLPIKKWLFLFALKKAHFYVPQRENNKFYSLKMFSASRRVFMELGNRLYKKGCLNEKEDVFFLTIPELELFSQKPEEQAIIIKECVKKRKLEWNRNKQIEPPLIIRSDGKSVERTMNNHNEKGSFLKGASASTGRIRGKARIIMDPALGSSFNKGEILVAPFTDPGWTPLFLTAKALVMESGGVFSHGAVVAREYGIPAVVSVTGATKIIKTGDEIIVDGNEGKVVLLAE